MFFEELKQLPDDSLLVIQPSLFHYLSMRAIVASFDCKTMSDKAS